METEDKPKRRSPISYRPPKDKWADLDARIAQSGLSANAYLTECIFGRSRHRPAEQKMLAQILLHCGFVADALRQVKQNEQLHPLVLEELQTELVRIRSALFVLLGRKP